MTNIKSDDMESIRGEEKAPSIVKNPTAVTVEYSGYSWRAWFLYLVGESFDAHLCNNNTSENHSGILLKFDYYALLVCHKSERTHVQNQFAIL